jgi:hypothetical protein
MKDPADLIDETAGKVRVLSRRCETCIFWPDDRMALGPERTAEVENENVRKGTLLTCHSTLPYGGHPDFGPAACHGFWTKHGRAMLVGRIAMWIGILKVDPPPADTAEEPQ